jgi:hypothetical protein
MDLCYTRVNFCLGLVTQVSSEERDLQGIHFTHNWLDIIDWLITIQIGVGWLDALEVPLPGTSVINPNQDIGEEFTSVYHKSISDVILLPRESQQKTTIACSLKIIIVQNINFSNSYFSFPVLYALFQIFVFELKSSDFHYFHSQTHLAASVFMSPGLLKVP